MRILQCSECKRYQLQGHTVPPVQGLDMLPYLASAAQAAREAAGRKQVHVAASLSKDQSTIFRFEAGQGWPRNPDAMIQAYADDLDIHPIEIWAAAVKRWRHDLNGQRASDGPGKPSPTLPGSPAALTPSKRPRKRAG